MDPTHTTRDVPSRAHLLKRRGRGLARVGGGGGPRTGRNSKSGGGQDLGVSDGRRCCTRCGDPFHLQPAKRASSLLLATLLARLALLFPLAPAGPRASSHWLTLIPFPDPAMPGSSSCANAWHSRACLQCSTSPCLCRHPHEDKGREGRSVNHEPNKGKHRLSSKRNGDRSPCSNDRPRHDRPCSPSCSCLLVGRSRMIDPTTPTSSRADGEIES